MEEKSKVTNEQQSNQTDYFILVTNINVVIIMLSCVFVYLVMERKL